MVLNTMLTWRYPGILTLSITYGYFMNILGPTSGMGNGIKNKIPSLFHPENHRRSTFGTPQKQAFERVVPSILVG